MQGNFYNRAGANYTQNNLVPVFETFTDTSEESLSIVSLIPDSLINKISGANVYISDDTTSENTVVSFNGRAPRIPITTFAYGTEGAFVKLDNAEQVSKFNIAVQSGGSPSKIYVVFYMNVTLS